MKREMTVMQIKRFFKYFGICIIILIASFLVLGQIAYYNVPIIDAPGKFYSVNGKEVHMYCTGPESNNQPTIIIISGGGTPSYVYDDLRENLSHSVRTCSYDIPGFGWSEPNDAPLTAKNMSDDLHQLLQTAQIDGPVILAGHSMGGLVSLIYSAEHEEQVAGIAFIDSSHYNQVDYFGKEFSDLVDRQTEEFLANFWLMELVNRLGIANLMNVISASSDSEQHREEHEISASLNRWNPPYAGMKSVVSNLKLSLEQAKEVHYARGDLPIIAIGASNVPLGGERPKGFSDQDLIDADRFVHKDLADLSNNGRHVIVNGTAHMSIIHHNETVDHILSIIPEINAVSSFHDEIIIDKYKDLPEVVAFYAEYDNAQVSVRKDHISYFVGSQDDYLLRMNLEFNENYEIENKEFHCYYKKTPQWEMSQEDIASRLALHDCGNLKSSSLSDKKLDLQ